MAGPTQKRNATLTFAAAGGTIGIIIAILAGPSVIECSSAPGGVGECLRDKIIGLGLLPGPGSTVVQPTVVAEPEAVEPAEPAPDAVAVETVALTLLRAEPNGSIVLGGRGKPGDVVTIFGNGTPIGTTTAEPGGDWAFIPDQPLTPGGTEITVGTADGTIVAPEAFVVIIDEQPAVEARVLASIPGKAGEVLGAIPLAEPAVADPETAATPEPEAATPEPETVAAPEIAPAEGDPVAPAIDQAAIDAGKAAAEAAASAPVTVVAEAPIPAAAPDRSNEVAAVPAEAAVAAGKAAADAAMASPVTQVAALPAPDAVEPDVVVTPDSTQLAMEAGRAAAAAAIAAPVIVVAALPEPAPSAVEPNVAAEAGRVAAQLAVENPVQQEIAVAAVEPGDVVSPDPDVAAVPMTPPTIDAIEIDGTENYFAGAGEEGATVRLYVEDVYVGDSKVEGGRWLVEAERTLTRPSQRIRVDMMDLEGDWVAATASINFVIDVPMPEGAEVAPPPDVASVSPETKPDSTPQGEAERSLDMSESSPEPADNRDIEAGNGPQVAGAGPEDVPSTPDATRTSSRGEAAPEPPAVEDLPLQINVAAVEAGKSAADLALANPVTVRAPTVDEAAPLEQAALAAGAAAANAAVASPVTIEPQVAELPAAVAPTLDPQVAIAAGKAAAELALLDPVMIEQPETQDRAEAAVVPKPTPNAVLAGAEAARVAVANPVTLAVEPPLKPTVATPPVEVAVVEPEPAADPAAAEAAGEAAAEIAVANPVAVEAPPIEVAVVEPEPVADPVAAEAAGEAAAEIAVANPVVVEALPIEVAVVEPEPAADPAAAVSAGEAAAQVAVANPVTVAAPLPAENDIPTLTAVPVGELEEARFATGKVIIRRGDTLWAIAKRVYGSGTKYQTIYRANRDQIRRPGRIFPGQIFDLPVVFDD